MLWLAPFVLVEKVVRRVGILEVAAVRVLLLNQEWHSYALAA